jgi:hypothetical protein
VWLNLAVVMYVDERRAWFSTVLAVVLVPVLVGVFISQVWIGMWISKSAGHLWGLAPGLLAWVAPVTTLFVDVHGTKRGIDRLLQVEVVGLLIGLPSLAVIVVTGTTTGVLH